LTAIAPRRAARPGAGSAEDPCPFCAGEEHRTPPPALVLGDPWQIRVVPNLYPALERQEVVIHAPTHVTSLTELADEQLELVSKAWQARRLAEPAGYLHAFVNEGREAGASREHSHSQLAWLPEPPPEVVREHSAKVCPLCEAPEKGLLLAERQGVRMSTAWAPRAAYELLITPSGHDADPWHDRRLAAALVLAADGLRRLKRVLGDAVPVNLWLHATEHWHLEVVPRTSVLAGLELGAGVYAVAVDPEEAAAELRAGAT
jgi:UDPglucose--hexose-1-phosphate uridylyltransferase